MASKLLVLLAILCVSFLILDFVFWRDGKAVVDPHDCKHHCEWQLAKMNETFNTLITVCEEKLQKLHGSDMNLAIIREQLHKEILELFWYEFQTFQRLHSSRIESVPQFCLEYCTAVDNAKHRECKENVTNHHYQIQMLLQRQRWLRIHIRRSLQLIRVSVSSIEPETLSMLWPSIIAIVIAVVALYAMVVAPTRSRLATMTEIKERIKAQLHGVQTQLSDSTSEKERIEVQLHVVQTQLLQAQENSVAIPQESSEEICLGNDSQLREKNLILMSWNEELLRCEKEYKDTLALKDKSLQNAHKFWHQRLHDERNARKTAEEKERASLDTIKAAESKHQWQLARENKGYQRTINELDTKLKQAQERDIEGEQIMLQRQEELEKKVRELEREITVLEVKLEVGKIEFNMERERKFRALMQVSGLEIEVNALKVQTARLVEGALKKGSKNSRLASQHPAQVPQEPNSLQLFDSKLEELRREFEARFMQIQSKFDNQVTRDSKELYILRSERQRLCENLELANRRNIQLESRLACQEPIHVSITPRHQLAWQRSRSLEQSDSFLTQPEFEPIIVKDVTDYSDYSLCSC